MTFDQGLLEAALIGLELQKARLEEQIAAVRAMTGGGKKAGQPRKVTMTTEDAAPTEPTKKAKKKGKRNLSPEARERIAAAQKKRWATARGEV